MAERLRDLIGEAIRTSKYKWRTARGIAKELQVREADVFQELRSSDFFVKAKKPNARGEPLFTTSLRYRNETSLIERLLGAAGNTVSE